MTKGPKRTIKIMNLEVRPKTKDIIMSLVGFHASLFSKYRANYFLKKELNSRCLVFSELKSSETRF